MKKILCTILVLALCAGSLLYVVNLVNSKSSATKLDSFFEEEKDFDVLFMGISHMQVGIYPLEMWDDYGFTSFNFGESGNRLPSNYWVLRNALNYTTPELVVIDVRRIDVNDMGQDAYIATEFDEFPLSMTKYEAAKDLFSDRQSQMEVLFPFLKYHTRWSQLRENDFTEEHNRINYGATHYGDNQDFSSTLKVAYPDSYPKVADDQKKEGGEIGVEYLRKMIELCQDKGIQVMLVELPYPADEESQMLANGVDDIAAEYDINYVNFLHMDGIVNFYTDMNDPDAHLNDSGAKKVSKWIGNYIQENYNLTDHREDSAYSDWNDHYENYLVYKENRLKEQTELQNYLMLLADKNYDILVEINNKDIWKVSKCRSLFENLGVNLDTITDNTKYLAVREDTKEVEVLDGFLENEGQADTLLGSLKCQSEENGTYSVTLDEQKCYEEELSLMPDLQITVFDRASSEIIESRTFDYTVTDRPEASILTIDEPSEEESPRS